MSATTSIEWTDRTWNPVRGCALVSEGCRNCYAMKVAHRFSGEGMPYAGLTELGPAGPRWTGRARIVPDALLEPLSWRKPRRVFVNSMSDLFHEDVPDEFIDQVFAVMRGAAQHTFQILTKRPARMHAYFERLAFEPERIDDVAEAICGRQGWCHLNDDRPWPLSNVWLGVSCENQHAVDDRILLLLETPAAVRFVSAEPLLEPIEIAHWLRERACPGQCVSIDGEWWHRPGSCAMCRPGLDWVIVGGESGASARPCDVTWVRSIVRQCAAADVACFVKQLGARSETDHMSDLDGHEARGPRWLVFRDRKGGDMAEWPEGLRVRQFPAVVA